MSNVAQLKLVDTPPKKQRKKSELHTLSTYLAGRKAEGKKLFDEGSGVLRYIAQAKLTDELVGLAWGEFREQHAGQDGPRRNHKQKDWPATFLNCLKQNWYGFWKINREGQYYLSDKGKQAQIVADSKKQERQK